jgi:hypothetical protein
MPSFLIASIAASTSSESNKLSALDTPDANEESKTHLILRLLSPETFIIFLKGFIFFLIIILLLKKFT